MLLRHKMAEQIADDLKLFNVIVRNFDVKTVFDCDHQFDAVEEVSAKVVNKMGLACYKISIDV